MNTSYILNRIKQNGRITLKLTTDESWDNDLAQFQQIITDNGYAIVAHKEVKAEIAYTVHNPDQNIGDRKRRITQIFDIEHGQSWADVWLEYKRNLPEYIRLWLSHTCKVPNGCVELIHLWITFEIVAPLSTPEQ